MEAFSREEQEDLDEVARKPFLADPESMIRPYGSQNEDDEKLRCMVYEYVCALAEENYPSLTQNEKDTPKGLPEY